METINKYIVYAIFTLIAISILAGGAYSILIWDIFPFAIVTIAFVVTGLIWVFGPKKLVILFLAILIMVGLVSIHNSWQVVVAKTNSAIIKAQPIYVYVEPDSPDYLERFYPSPKIFWYFLLSVVLGILSHLIWNSIDWIKDKLGMRKFEVHSILGITVVLFFVCWPIDVYSHDQELITWVFFAGVFVNTIGKKLINMIMHVLGLINFLAEKANRPAFGEAVTWSLRMNLIYDEFITLMLCFLLVGNGMRFSDTMTIDVLLVTIVHAKFVSLGLETMWLRLKRKYHFLHWFAEGGIQDPNTMYTEFE